MKAILLIALLTGSAAAVPQQAEQESLISITDRSSTGSPLLVKGDVTAKDRPTEKLRYSVSGRVSLTNVSSKPILLTVVSFEGTNAPGVNDRWSQDYYFSDPFEPESTMDHEWTFGPFVSRMEVKSEGGSKWVDLEPERGAQQRVIASVLFIQYADGSSWGDKEEANTALAVRQETVKTLTALASIYRENGETALVRALSESTGLPAVSSLQNFCQHSDDKSKVVDRLFRTLATVDEHARTMKSGHKEHPDSVRSE
jgi:hypothetical protein